MAVGRGFFDQYSVFCVFGSVVGCVVVPLITQSVESVIFSAIVISLTATHLTKRANKSDTSNQAHVNKEMDRRNSRKAKDRDSALLQAKKKPKAPSQSHQMVVVRSSDCRKRREDEIRRLEIAKQLEWERKQEEKKERKIKKKEERTKRKEQEKEVKEKEQQRVKEIREQRYRAQKENQKHSEKAPVQRLDSWKGRSVTSKLGRKPESQSVKTLYKLPASSLNVVSYVRQRSLSDESESDIPTPPPSVWKVPEYVEPKWNPGKPENGSLPKRPLKETRLNNDVVREKVRPETPFNQLHNPVHTPTTPSNVKNQLMNQKGPLVNNTPDVDASYSVLKGMDKPDNRQTSSYSSFSGLPNLLSQLKRSQNPAESKPYTLFGPDQPNSSIFRSPLSGQ